LAVSEARRGPVFRVLLVLVLLGAVWAEPLTGQGMRYLDRSIHEGVTVFVGARAINAAIAVIKGTEIQVEPFGVGAVVAAGKVLEPLDDLLERFTWVLFGALAVLAAEKVLLTLMSALSVKVALSVLAVPVLLVSGRRGGTGPAGGAAVRVFGFAMLIRFAPVLVVLASQGVYLTALSGPLDDASRALHAQTSGVQEIARTREENGSVVGRLRDQAKVLTRVRQALETLKQGFDRVVEQVTRMVGIFLLEVVVLPLGFAWLAWRASRGAMHALAALFGTARTSAAP